MSTRTRLSAPERREQLLAVAGRLMRDAPAGSVSMDAVAQEAGVTEALVYHHFGSKRDLQLEVLRRLFRGAPPVPPARPGATVRERLEESTSRWLDMVQAGREAWLAAMGAEGLGRDPEVEALLDRVREAAVDNIVQVLELGEPASVAPATRAALRAFGGFAEAATRQWLEAGRLDREQVQTLLVGTLLAVVEDVVPALPA